MYLRIVMTMWSRDVEAVDAPPLAVSWTTGLALFATVAVTLVYGFIPQSLIGFVRDAVPQLVAGG
jgi:NADH:ubiquinone oxidoreductase subunit 2 (subunit N)